MSTYVKAVSAPSPSAKPTFARTWKTLGLEAERELQATPHCLQAPGISALCPGDQTSDHHRGGEKQAYCRVSKQQIGGQTGRHRASTLQSSLWHLEGCYLCGNLEAE